MNDPKYMVKVIVQKYLSELMSIELKVNDIEDLKSQNVSVTYFRFPNMSQFIFSDL